MFSLGKKLRAEGKSEEKVKEAVAKERVRLQGEMTKNKDKMDLRDKH